MVISIAAALLAPLLKLYSYGGLEPFLMVSAGQTLFYMLLRLSCEVIDSIADIYIIYTPYARGLYLATIVLASALMFSVTHSLPAAAILAVCSSAWMRSSLQCAAGSSGIKALLMNGCTPYTAPKWPSILEAFWCLLLVIILPLLPCALSAAIFTLPAMYSLPAAIAVVLLIVHPPATWRGLVEHVGNTMTGAALFPTRSKGGGAVQFDRSTALALISMLVWVFVLFAQAGIVEEARKRPAVESYFFTAVRIICVSIVFFFFCVCMYSV